MKYVQKYQKVCAIVKRFDEYVTDVKREESSAHASHGT